MKRKIKFRKGSGLMPSRPHKDKRPRKEKKKDIKELEDSLTEIGEKEYNLDYYEKLVKDILTSESPEEQNIEEAYREHTDIRQ